MAATRNARRDAIAKAKDCYWYWSRRAIRQEGFTAIPNGYRWQGESSDGNEWVVILRVNGNLDKASRVLFCNY